MVYIINLVFRGAAALIEKLAENDFLLKMLFL